MVTSAEQLAANQKNAIESTGPRTVAGKAKASRNALRHGLFSSRLFLEGEDPEEFEELTFDLHETLRPVGAIEHALMERIALNFWRQRRLIQAETAILSLGSRDQKIASTVSDELERSFSSQIRESDLVPFDKIHAKWCQSVLNEYEELEVFELNEVSKNAPLIHKQLKSDADEDGDTIEKFLDEYEHGLTSYLDELVRWCRKQIQEAEERPKIMTIAQFARSKKMLLPQGYLELLARYQTTLDNQLYKALSAFRNAQEWRLKTLEGDTIEPSEDAIGAISA